MQEVAKEDCLKIKDGAGESWSYNRCLTQEQRNKIPQELVVSNDRELRTRKAYLRRIGWDNAIPTFVFNELS